MRLPCDAHKLALNRPPFAPRGASGAISTDAVATARYPMSTAPLSDWQSPPARCELAAGRIDVWRIDLPGPDRDTARPPDDRTGKGSSGEREVAHRALYDLLGRYLGLPQDAVRIGRRAGAKPWLEAPAADIAFNLSHTRGCALLAIGSDCQIGVDVEPLRPIGRALQIARRVMPRDAVRELERLAPAARERRFVELWTRMEACQKAFGEGIFGRRVGPGEVDLWPLRPGQGLVGSLAAAPPAPGRSIRGFVYTR